MRCRVNNLATFRVLRVNNLATYKSITWPPFLAYKNSVFWSIFSAQFSGGGAKLVFGKVVFGQKRGFPKMGGAIFVLGGGSGFR